MNCLTILICLFLIATSAESLSIEDRLEQVETQLSSTNIELKEVKKKNAFLQTEIGDLKHEDEKNKQKIQQLVEENKVIRIELAEVKRDRVEDGEEVKKLKSQVESQREELMEAKSQIDDLDRRIQEIQTNCCHEDGQQSTATELTTFTSSLTNEVTDSAITTTEEPMNTEIEVVDIGTPGGRMAVIKKLNYVATGWSNGVRIYNLRSKQLVRTLGNLLVLDIQPFRQKQLLQATASAIKIWNVESGELLRTIQCESCGNIFSIALNSDESLMLSGDRNNQVILWDMTEYKEIRRFRGHSSSVSSVLFNEAKDQVISGSDDNTIKIWNMNDGSLIRTLTGHSSGVIKVLLDQETGHLYSASYDNTIKEWDIESGNLLRTFTGHASAIFNMMWSEDRKRLISSSADRSVRIWSKETGQQINRLNHSDYLLDLALNPLNGQLMTTTGDNKLIFWPLRP